MAHASSKVNPPLPSAFSPFTSHVSRFLLFDSSGDLFTEDNQENEEFLGKKLFETWCLVGYRGVRSGESKRNFVTFVSFCLIRSRQDHPRDAVVEDWLMEVDEQP